MNSTYVNRAHMLSQAYLIHNAMELISQLFYRHRTPRLEIIYTCLPNEFIACAILMCLCHIRYTLWSPFGESVYGKTQYKNNSIARFFRRFCR